MLCLDPVIVKGNLYPCGQCDGCRIQRRKVWTSRLILERNLSERSCFVTLTYNDEHLPSGASLNRKDLVNFFKRLRKSLDGLKLRYYYCGEYGSQTERPHYHFCAYGIDEQFKPFIDKAWRVDGEEIGFSEVLPLTDDSCKYVAGYVNKKLGKKKGDEWLQGRKPEFQGCSTRPGIAGASVADFVGRILDKYGEDLLRDGDVPTSIIRSGKSLPLGRYLRRKIREGVFGDEKAPEQKQLKEEMQRLREACKVVSEDVEMLPGIKVHRTLYRENIKDVYMRENAGKIAHLKHCVQLFRRKEKL